MFRFLLILLALFGLLPAAAQAGGQTLEIYFSANTYGYYDPCPG
jgi:hypothetical protein